VNVDAKRWHEAALCARSVIDQFFVEMGYGTMVEATVMAERIADRLDEEGRLS